MTDIFYSSEDFLKSKYVLQVGHIWKDSFPDDLGEFEGTDVVDNVDIKPETLIHLYLSPKGRTVYGVACYFLATEEALEENHSNTDPGEASLRDQGIRIGDAYLHNLAISKKKRRKGLALKMLMSAEKYLKDNCKRKRILLCVLANNPGAVALYNKLHYKVTRAIPTGFLMEKNLI